MTLLEPPHLVEARKDLGVREIRGPRHSPAVLAMIRDAGPQPARPGQPARRGWLGMGVSTDEVPWCGTAVAAWLARAGFLAPRGAIGVRARWWENYGEELPLDGPAPVGAIDVFWRGSPDAGTGHVGLEIGRLRNGDVALFGGNQDNSVSIASFPRGQLVARRWPPGLHRYFAPISLKLAGIAAARSAA